MGSNEYPQSMFWSKNNKKYVYPCKPQFYYIKVGFKGVFIARTSFPDALPSFKKKNTLHNFVFTLLYLLKQKKEKMCITI